MITKEDICGMIKPLEWKVTRGEDEVWYAYGEGGEEYLIRVADGHIYDLNGQEYPDVEFAKTKLQFEYECSILNYFNF